MLTNNAYAKSTTVDIVPPLVTRGATIIDHGGNGKVVYLKGVNWYGGHMPPEVPGGLDKQKLSYIVHLIKSKGFNSVRLTFSNQMLHSTNIVQSHYLSKNPELQGKTPLEVFDAVIKELTAQHILVVLNNHTTLSKWCCSYDTNGLWHTPFWSTYPQTTQQWQNDWVMLAKRYQSNPYVIGMELRNEVRTANAIAEIPVYPNWGSGDYNDWHLAAQNAGNAILAVNPNLLIFVEGINWRGIPGIEFGIAKGYRPYLEPIKESNLPIDLNVANRVVYVAHNYSYTGPQDPGGGPSFVRIPPRYEDMDVATFNRVLTEEWGFVATDPRYAAPVWVDEFGASYCSNPEKCSYTYSEKTERWLENLTNYILAHRMSWAWWPLNPTRFDLTPVEPDYSGLLNDDWSAYRDDWRFKYIDKLLQEGEN